MLDFGISELALIAVVALVVIGPEKLPRVARTVGTLLGKAQRYVADVKAEVNRSMDLEELKKMKESVEGAAREVQSGVGSFEKDWMEATAGLEGTESADPPPRVDPNTAYSLGHSVYPPFTRPKKSFRLRQQSVPKWYKARTGQRSFVQSGAARVARHRPKTYPVSSSAMTPSR